MRNAKLVRDLLQLDLPRLRPLLADKNEGYDLAVPRCYLLFLELRK
jgi:hypothetical protein